MERSDERGTSLVEAVIAVSVLAAGVAAVAQLALVAGRANVAAQRASVVVQASREKMEQLRSLAWTSDAAVVPVSDWVSDLTTTPALATGGVGLGMSPADALLANVAGYCDFLDASGRWLAGGNSAPAGAAWVRRWSIQPVESLGDMLMFQVVVVPAGSRDGAVALSAARGTNGAWLVDMRVRRAR